MGKEQNRSKDADSKFRKIIRKLLNLVINKYSVTLFGLGFVALLSFIGEFVRAVPTLIAALVYALQLSLVQRLFVDQMEGEWTDLEARETGCDDMGTEYRFSSQFLSLACWGAAAFLLFLFLALLLCATILVGYRLSPLCIHIAFAMFALVGAVLAYCLNGESIPSATNLKEKFFPKMHHWIRMIDKLAVAMTVLVLVMTLHALGSILGITDQHNSMRPLLKYITYLHSFAVMSGVFYVYMTHQILSHVNSQRMQDEFPMISLGLLLFYGGAQTVLIIAVHFPVYLRLYPLSGGESAVPIGEIISALGPLISSLVVSIVVKLLSERRQRV
ncbi:MAG: hypothetical protein OXE84_01810 [Rhodobacteraceae bacterium]|nr:hypothetical protein [Paracoccaceae bacterium]